MTLWKRRRVIKAALAGVLLNWTTARAQTSGQAPRRELRAQSSLMTSGGSLLTVPRRALVIGNSSYSIGPLKNPANDATAIAEELKRQGFEVTLGLDVRRDEMLQLIGAYSQALAHTKPVALFYFAGHGLQIAWRNYLVPIDATIAQPKDVQERCVDVNAVIEGIGKAANPMNVVILDACRDNPFAAQSRVEQKGLSQLDAPPWTLLAYATSPGNIAIDGDGANSLYTEHLLREIKVPEAKIEDVFKRVRLGVRRRSNGRQIPWESTSLEEDFWFIPPRAVLQLAQEEAERARRLQDAPEAERARLEQLEKARQQEREREYQAEVALWEKADGANEPGLLEEYLRRYPSGRFAELAQLQLDRVLAAQGEKKIQIGSAHGNPFTKGSAFADTGYKIGDSYTFAVDDRVKQETRRFTQRVTQVTDNEIIFNDGRLVFDRLGNLLKLPDGRRYTGRQDYPLEFAIGKKWKTRYSVKNETGARWEPEFEFRIVRRERVTVPAGSFDCFVIEGEGWSSTEKGFKVLHNLKRWMAPDKCRRAIVTEQFHRIEGLVGRPFDFGKKGTGRIGEVLRDDRFELVAFSQS